MTRDEAVTRIKEGLGFWTGTALDQKIIDRLVEAQRELEKGITLPKFLLQEDQALSLGAGEHDIALPSRFIRLKDEESVRYFSSGSVIPKFQQQRMYDDASLAYLQQINPEDVTTQVVGAPMVYVIRKSTIDFIRPADQAYSLTWSYYKGGELLSSATSNVWLDEEPEWLIGEAGLRLAISMRDSDAIAGFKDMMERAKSSRLREIFASELQGGPMVMGADN